MSTRPLREWLLPVVLLLQVLTLVLLLPGLLEQSAAGRRREEAQQRAQELGATGTALEDQGKLAGARRAYQAASRLAVGAGALALAEEYDASADAARAKGVLAGSRLPAPSLLHELEALVPVLEAAGRRATAAALEAACLDARGRVDEAKARLEQAQKAESLDSPWLAWRLGALLARQRQFEVALPHLERAARDLPYLAPVPHQLGLTYAALGRRPDAIATLRRAIERGGGPEPALDVARLHLKKKQWADALPFLEGVVRDRPDHAEALRLLASTYFRLERFLEAADTYRRAHAVEPSPRTLMSVAVALHGAEAYEEALKVVDALLLRVDELPEILFQRALVLMKLERLSTALSDLYGYLEAAEGHAGEERRRALARRHIDRLHAIRPPLPGFESGRPGVPPSP